MLSYTIEKNTHGDVYKVWNDDWGDKYQSITKTEFSRLEGYCDMFDISLTELSDKEYQDKLAEDIKGCARDYS